MNLAAPPIVLASVAIAAASACFLLVLSHPPLRIASPGRRFKAAAAAALALWVAASAVIGAAGLPTSIFDVLSGAMILVGALMAGFIVWSLIAWGFTLSMLLAIARFDGAVTVDEWSALYARGKSMREICLDRVGVLLAFGLAKKRGEEVIVSGRISALGAKAVLWLRRLFAIE